MTQRGKGDPPEQDFFWVIAAEMDESKWIVCASHFPSLENNPVLIPE